MPKEANIDFVSIIKDVFSPIFSEYGFVLKEEAIWDGRGENKISASKTDIEVDFYIGLSPMYYYCGVGIKLSGEIGEKATPYEKYRNMGVAAIAKGKDPNYEIKFIDAQTREDVIKAFESERDLMLKYCKDILAGDVSAWTPIADKMAREWAQKQEVMNKKTETKPSKPKTGLAKLFGKK